LEPELIQRVERMPADDCLTGWIAAHDEPLAVTDMANLSVAKSSQQWRTSSIVRRSGLRSFVGVPMNAKGLVIGVLSVFRDIRRPFSQEDIALLNSVADQIGTAIENARLHQENEQLLVLDERNRLARELHDAVTQSLYSLTLFAETGNRLLGSGRIDMAQDVIERIGSTAQQALREMRLLLHNLRPSVLEQVGLEKALLWRLDAVERRAGVKATLDVRGSLQLPVAAEEAIYHIAQEALNNALKHAGATHVAVKLTQVADKVTLHVTDDGIGFDVSQALVSGGLGLSSMRERVERLHGTAAIESAESVGTTVCVELDLSSIADANETADFFALLRRSGA
jgi:signal transduction histidine kinase